MFIGLNGKWERTCFGPDTNALPPLHDGIPSSVPKKLHYDNPHATHSTNHTRAEWCGDGGASGRMAFWQSVAEIK